MKIPEGGSKKWRDAIKDHRSQFRNVPGEEQAVLDISNGAYRWPMYERSMEKYLEDFGKVYKKARDVPARLEAQRQAGHKTRVVDVCGIAYGGPINADETINVVAVEGDEMKNLPASQKVISGDVAAKDTQKKLFEDIDSGGGVDCVFFRPGGGLAHSNENIYLDAQMQALLLGLMRRLNQNGEIYMRIDSLHNKDWFAKLPSFLDACKKTLAQEGVFIETYPQDMFGSQFFVRIERS